MQRTLRRLATLLLLAVAPLAIADDAAPPPETAALLEVAIDDGNGWRARAAALRLLATADRVPAAPLVALSREAEPDALRRLAVAALVATCPDGEVLSGALADALADPAPGVRREALMGVTARAAHCTERRDAVIGLLRDDDDLVRAHAVRAVSALAEEAVDVRDAAAVLLALLAEPDAGPLAARALLAARPERAQLESHEDALDALLRAPGGPVPAAIVLRAWSGRSGPAWNTTLRAFIETGSPGVVQAAWFALGLLDDAGAAAASTRARLQALLGPDAIVVAAALRTLPADAIPAALTERLQHHASKLVRTLAAPRAPPEPAARDDGQ